MKHRQIARASIASAFVMSMVLPYIPLIGYVLLFTLYPLIVLTAYKAAVGVERPALF